MGTVTGWGRVGERKPTSDVLRKVDVPLMSQEECQQAGYPAGRITDNMVCAGYPKGLKDACQVAQDFPFRTTPLPRQRKSLFHVVFGVTGDVLLAKTETKL